MHPFPLYILLLWSSLPTLHANYFEYCFDKGNNGICDLECNDPIYRMDEKDCKLEQVETIDFVIEMDVNLVPHLSNDVTLSLRMILKGNVTILDDMPPVNSRLVVEPEAKETHRLKILLQRRPCSTPNCTVAIMSEALLLHSFVRKVDVEQDNSTTSQTRHIVALLVLLTLLVLVAGTLLRSRRQRFIKGTTLWMPPMEGVKIDSYSKSNGAKKSLTGQIFHTQAFLNRYIDSNEQQHIHQEAPRPPSFSPPVPPHLYEAGTAIHDIVLRCDVTADFDDVTNQIYYHMTHGVHLEAQNSREETALLLAVRMNKLVVAEALIRLGADGTTMDEYDSTVLHHAVHNLDEKMLRMLLGYENIVNTMVDGRRAIEAVNKRDETALMCASGYPAAFSIPLAKLLIQYGADPTYAGDTEALHHRGLTVLHHAAKFNNTGFIEFLVHLPKAALDLEDVEGCTAFWHAAALGNVEAVEVLLKSGANPSIPNQMDLYPRDIARQNGFPEIANRIEEAYRKRKVMPAKPKAVLPKRKRKHQETAVERNCFMEERQQLIMNSPQTTPLRPVTNWGNYVNNVEQQYVVV